MRSANSKQQDQAVTITYYRWAGRFLWFRIAESCRECELTYALLQQLLAAPLRDRPVTVVEKPWLDNWWRVIWRGGWHAPIITVNGRVFSQGIVPDAPRLLQTIARALGDPALEARATAYAPKRGADMPSSPDIVVYESPACPHCRGLLRYLDAHNVAYASLDVSQSFAARKALQDLTGGMRIPVVQAHGQTIAGFDKTRLREVLGLADSEETDIPEAVRRPTPLVDPSAMKRMVLEAQALLASNRHNGRTRASQHLYPHQWNWDSGFIARGYLHFDPEKAYEEMRSLFSAQWSSGFLPHMVFNPDALDHFPGPDYWKAERSGQVPAGVYTSGISQPPVHASMLVCAVDLDSNRERALAFLNEMYPKLKSLHDFFFAHRDPYQENLICLVHPWESGIDNAPLWDGPLSHITTSSVWAEAMQKQYDELAEEGDRPKRTYLEKYSYLVESLYTKDYDWERILKEHGFLIQDVLFNSVLCQAERDLGRIASLIGSDPAPHEARSDAIALAMNTKLWDEADGTFYSHDLVANSPLKHDTIFSYLPMYAGICDEARGQKLMDHLVSHCFCLADRNCVGIPTYDMCAADYQGEFYWRGPVWFNMCWYMVTALRRYGNPEQADWLMDSLLALVIENGFYEYYEPETGKGLGADGFSWTAALFLDLAADKINKEARE